MTAAFSSNDSENVDRKVEIENTIEFKEIWDDNELEKCRDFIKTNDLKKVCLQFPDELLGYSIKISDEIKLHISSVEVINNVELYILGDTSYGSCCVDEVAASHVNADAIIHFGHACLTKITRIQILYILPKIKFANMDNFVKIIEDKFPIEHNVIIFYNCGYYHYIEQLKSQLSALKHITFATLALDGESDILCWKINRSNMEHYECIYLGSDDQLFFNLTVSIKGKNWYIFNPSKVELCNDLRIIMNPMGTMWMRRRYYYIEKCKDARSLGLVVATLTANGYLDIISNIQKMARANGVRTYILSVGKINPAKLANFIDIDCFVLIGCPENNLFTSKDFYKPLVTPFEIEIALNPYWHDKYPDSYCIDFKDILLYHQPIDEQNTISSNAYMNDVSLITGRVRISTTTTTTDDPANNGNVLERNDNDGKPEMAVQKKNQDIAIIDSATAFKNRSWTGLDPALGKTEPAKVIKGRRGIAMKYTDSNESAT